MNPTLNHLVQLQELVLIRDEQKVAGVSEHLEQLDNSIRTMTARLPKDVRTSYEKLHKKDHIVVAPISGETCSVCGMRITISQIQAVRIGRDIHHCSNCARMLYYTESAPRRVAERRRRTVPIKAGISRFSSEALMVPQLTSDDMDGVIRELATKMEAEGFVDGAEKLIEEALRREAIISTAVDHGLAFPHVRHVEGGGVTLALGIKAKGIHFDGPESQLTRIVFFLVIPTAASAFYLKLLAGLTETFMHTEARKALLAAKDKTELWKTLVKVTRATIK